MGELPIVIDGSINDSDEYLIWKVNKMLTSIIGDKFNFDVSRITRVTEEIDEGVLKPGYVCVWID